MVVVVAQGHAQDLFGFLLFNHEAIEVRLYVARFVTELKGIVAVMRSDVAGSSIVRGERRIGHTGEMLAHEF